MAPRLQLHSLFAEMVEHVYFQPPANVTMQYPCIVYHRDGGEIQHADDLGYRRTRRYQVTVIDRNPDSNLPDKVEELPLCRFDRSFAADDLNHYVFNLFF